MAKMATEKRVEAMAYRISDSERDASAKVKL